MITKRKKITVSGVVQGVGFRPFVYRLAQSHGLSGHVLNQSGIVIIEAEGSDSTLDSFCDHLSTNAPLTADVQSVHSYDIETCGETTFEIMKSRVGVEHKQICPDLSICDACTHELLDRSNRRFHYPLLNCIDCGPRFSIIRQLPYDRHQTTMDKFSMCATCRDEYESVDNRRFHAQPNACPNCGPVLYAVDCEGNTIPGDPVTVVHETLKSGRILAVKGIGGFHLVCNAMDAPAVRLLRERKCRPNRPFAVMVKDLETARRYCVVSNDEAKQLSSPVAPIVILKKNKECALPDSISGGLSTLGVMLPYAPLHHLLFDAATDILIMTSANISGEPILFRNEDALAALHSTADVFICHNRDIIRPVDDSLVRINQGQLDILRRARGIVPNMLKITGVDQRIVALGAELKNTFAFATSSGVHVSQHNGTISSLESLNNFADNLDDQCRLFGVTPDIAVHDLHPQMNLTLFAPEVADTTLAVQHHHAHIVSCMADNAVTKTVIGLAFDGTGYGDDGTIWGGEFLYCDYSSYKRVAHIEPFLLPGGDYAIREPWRTAVSLLISFCPEYLETFIELSGIKRQKIAVVEQMVGISFNTSLTSSMGRLFDGVSALLGFGYVNTYEGEAAITMEDKAARNTTQSFPYTLDTTGDTIIIQLKPIISAVCAGLASGVSTAVLAAQFHTTIAECSAEVCRLLKDRYSCNTVALSGGVFQNKRLVTELTENLLDDRFDVLTHNQLPCNDGGLSLGQLMIADTKIKSENFNKRIKRECV